MPQDYGPEHDEIYNASSVITGAPVSFFTLNKEVARSRQQLVNPDKSFKTITTAGDENIEIKQYLRQQHNRANDREAINQEIQAGMTSTLTSLNNDIDTYGNQMSTYLDTILASSEKGDLSTTHNYKVLGSHITEDKINTETYENCDVTGNNCPERCKGTCLSATNCAGSTFTLTGGGTTGTCDLYNQNGATLRDELPDNINAISYIKSSTPVFNDLNDKFQSIRSSTTALSNEIYDASVAQQTFRDTMVDSSALQAKRSQLNNAKMTITKIEDDIQLSREQKIEADNQIIYYNFLYFVVSVLFILGILFILKRMNIISSFWYNMYIYLMLFLILFKYDLVLALSLLIIALYTILL
jgi:hypothetical protein